MKTMILGSLLAAAAIAAPEGRLKNLKDNFIRKESTL